MHAPLESERVLLIIAGRQMHVLSGEKVTSIHPSPTSIPILYLWKFGAVYHSSGNRPNGFPRVPLNYRTIHSVLIDLIAKTVSFG